MVAVGNQAGLSNQAELNNLTEQASYLVVLDMVGAIVPLQEGDNLLVENNSKIKYLLRRKIYINLYILINRRIGHCCGSS